MFKLPFNDTDPVLFFERMTMNTILSTPRRLVMALVAAGAIGALGHWRRPGGNPQRCPGAGDAICSGCAARSA
jgi:hypothetical protein